MIGAEAKVMVMFYALTPTRIADWLRLKIMGALGRFSKKQRYYPSSHRHPIAGTPLHRHEPCRVVETAEKDGGGGG